MPAPTRPSLAYDTVSPLNFLLAVMRDTSQSLPRRLEAAAAAAPYCHQRLVRLEHADHLSRAAVADKIADAADLH
jgi:hypothetical protein